MNVIVDSLNQVAHYGHPLPFSVYASVFEQKLLNVPIAKPLLIAVLSGNKHLGPRQEIVCKPGEFVVLADGPSINMRNIPSNRSYRALLIEFEPEDFRALPRSRAGAGDYLTGKITAALAECLAQFIRCSTWATPDIVSLRRQEILMLLHHLGATDIVAMKRGPTLSYRLHELLSNNEFSMTLEAMCVALAMSESTLRRALSAEGTSVTEVRDKARLGFALHLLQSTDQPISVVASQAGYSSQSRFTERFKGHFGLTPTALRKTRLTD